MSITPPHTGHAGHGIQLKGKRWSGILGKIRVGDSNFGGCMNEEILKLAKEKHYKAPFDWYAFDSDELEAFYKAAYNAGYNTGINDAVNACVKGNGESFYKAAFNAGIEAAAKVCDWTAICGSQGMAGPTCCILPRGHDGHHKYGVPMAMTQVQCVVAIRALEIR